MRRNATTLAGVLAGLFIVLALFHGLFPEQIEEQTCGLPVREVFSDDTETECRRVSLDNVADAFMWTMLALPATLAYAVLSRGDSDGE